RWLKLQLLPHKKNLVKDLFKKVMHFVRHSGISVRGNLNSDDDLAIKQDSNDIISASDSQKRANFIKRNIAIQTILFGVVIFGSSLVMSDGLLTPAISVISAVEGIAVPMPSLAPAIIPLSCFIIVVLFLSQRFGTDKVGSLYAPSISLWFIAITSIGIWNISQYPEIFKAYNPYYAFDYFIRKKDAGFTDLGGIFLAITGVEALFADLGHFNKKAIQISFPFCVFIPLVLVYTGQAARLVLDPTIVSNTFWLTTPSHPEFDKESLEVDYKKHLKIEGEQVCQSVRVSMKACYEKSLNVSGAQKESYTMARRIKHYEDLTSCCVSS
ncbi:3185_t:CDS:2, partial [Scutellospora calospora]